MPPSPSPKAVPLPHPRPAPAGSPQILDALKRHLGMFPAQPLPTTTEIGPDRFPLRDDSPLRDEHELLSAILEEMIRSRVIDGRRLDQWKSGAALIEMAPEPRGRVLLAASERQCHLKLVRAQRDHETNYWRLEGESTRIVAQLLKHPFDLDRDGLIDLLLFMSVQGENDPIYLADHPNRLIAAMRRHQELSPLTEGERYVMFLFRCFSITTPPVGEETDIIKNTTRLIDDDISLYLIPGEIWTDALNQEIALLDEKQREAWIQFLGLALSATSARPSSKWLKTAGQHIQSLGEEHVQEALLRWFPLFPRGRSLTRLGSYSSDPRGHRDYVHPDNANALRGLLWCTPLLPGRDQLARAITSLAISAYKKLPGVGPRATKVGNAAIYALSEMASKDAVGQLAMLKVRVKFGTAQKEIAKAFDASSKALGLPADQIEELGVPSYGLEEVGLLTEELAGYRAELHVTGSDAKIQWHDPAGKALKSVPAKVKAECKEEWKELQQSLKDIQSMLPAQCDRIDRLFLLQKSWPVAEWRERYHDHPLVGTIAQRLIWCLDGTPVLYRNGTPTDVAGNPVPHGQTAEITLWHPVGRSVEEITSWRQRLEQDGITQPFKQAHREVYSWSTTNRPRASTRSSRSVRELRSVLCN